MSVPATFRSFIGWLLLATAAGAQADEVRVAVASNFAHTARLLADRYAQDSGHDIRLLPGSTGKHYAQIIHGAPFDVFLAADSARPERLEQQKIALPETRFTYALGKLILWSPRAGYVDDTGERLLRGDYARLAIANPKLAPYGRAAREVMEHCGVWDTQSSRTVRGENIAQTFQFVDSGNAELGFVAYSQILTREADQRGSWWEVGQDLYAPIEQQAVLLRDTPAARGFLVYLQTADARALIRQQGYGTP